MVIDPAVRSHDWNMLNNRKARGLLGILAHAPAPSPTSTGLLARGPGATGSPSACVPVLWYNDAGGVTVGGAVRTDYLGRFEQNTVVLSIGNTGRLGRWSDDARSAGTSGVANPARLQAPRTTADASRPTGSRAAPAWRRRRAADQPAPDLRRADLTRGGPRWLVTTETDIPRPRTLGRGGHRRGVSLDPLAGAARARGRCPGRLRLGGGVEYRNRGGGLCDGKLLRCAALPAA